MFKKTTINFALLSKERIYFVFGSLVINIKPRVMLLFTVINFSVCFESARWWSFFLGHVIFGCYDLWVTTLQLIITWLFFKMFVFFIIEIYWSNFDQITVTRVLCTVRKHFHFWEISIFWWCHVFATEISWYLSICYYCELSTPS